MKGGDLTGLERGLLKNRVEEEFTEQIMNAFLDVLILGQIERKTLSGYDILCYIHDEYGMIMSPGTVYSSLYSMERRGLIHSASSKNKRMYQLTGEGAITIDTIRNSRVIRDFMIKIIGKKLRSLSMNPLPV